MGFEFRSLVGFDELLRHWQGLVQVDGMPHVTLLEGRAGIGKSGLLQALTALHVCETRTACGSCVACRLLATGHHPEVLWLDDPAGTGKLPLDVIGELQEHLALSPAAPARYRIVVLVDADRLTSQAANSLLKILEEPPPAARIFLSTSRPKAMLETILSRCVKWRIAPPKAEESLRWLAAKMQTEDAACATEKLAAALKCSGLAPGAAWRYLTHGDSQVLSERLTRLMTSRHPHEIIQEAELLIRESGMDLTTLLGAWERELNARYAQGLGAEGGVIGLKLRREKLRELKALAIQAKISLSATLSVESLALSGI